MLTKYIKFCVVGGTGAIITWGLTYLLTDKAGWWYMASVVLATVIAMTWNFTWNYRWTFKADKLTPESPEYEWESFYHGSIVQRWWKQRIASIVWDWIPDASEIINIGCGSSPICTKYPKSVNLDVDKKKLFYMREKFPAGTFIYGDARMLPLEDGKYDHAICIEVIEHVSKPEEVVREIARVLKPGGDCVIATPDYAKGLWHVAELFTPYKEWHGAKLTRHALEAMCRMNHLALVEYKYVAKCDLVAHFKKET